MVGGRKEQKWERRGVNGERSLCLCSALLLTLMTVGSVAQEGPLLLFAVITDIAQEDQEVTAQVYVGGHVAETALIPSERVLHNPMWKKLEICQSLKAEAWKVPAGYRIATLRMVGAGMLPMALQGIAGDCLLKKILEFAPLLDE